MSLCRLERPLQERLRAGWGETDPQHPTALTQEGLGKPRQCAGLQQPLHAPSPQPTCCLGPPAAVWGRMLDPAPQHSEQGNSSSVWAPQLQSCGPEGDFCPIWGALPHARVTQPRGAHRDAPTAATVQCPFPRTRASTLALPGSSLTLATKGLSEQGQGHHSHLQHSVAGSSHADRSPAGLHRSIAHRWQPAVCWRSPAPPQRAAEDRGQDSGGKAASPGHGESSPSGLSTPILPCQVSVDPGNSHGQAQPSLLAGAQSNLSAESLAAIRHQP